MLLLSGVISFFGLQKLRQTTQYLLVQSRQSMELSKDMLDAVQEQNTALLMSITDSLSVEGHARIIAAGRTRFTAAYDESRRLFPGAKELDTLLESNASYEHIIDRMVGDTAVVNNLSDFADVYQNSYSNLTHSIKNFMMLSQKGIQEYSSDISEKGYRAYMVGIIALICGAIVVLMFYFLMSYYFLSPVIRITNALSKYLSTRATFVVNIESHDEILTLKENIEALIDISKPRKTE